MLVLKRLDTEVLRGIHNLRYLTLEQLHRGWFGARSFSGCKFRVSTFSTEGLIERVPVPQMGISALRLTSAGVVTLRRLVDGEFTSYEALSPLYLPHLLATNEVFIALAQGEWKWDELPFVWVGSHRARIPFVELAAAEGAARRRRRVLAADAIVTPKRGAQGPRCFVELDRSTECISEAVGRRSILGKLKAYRVLTRLPQPGQDRTAYEQVFAREPRPPRVVFVVTANDAARRRQRAILDAARKVGGDLDVRCVSLADVGALRDAIGMGGGTTSSAVVPGPTEVSVTSLEKLIRFHRSATGVLRRASFDDADERARISGEHRDAHQVLQRLKASSANS